MLQYKHLGLTEFFGDVAVEVRAEVGLLTHNVKIQGKGDSAFEVMIPACDADFNPGIILCIRVV